MSAITLDGKLYMKEHDRAFKAEEVVRFLKSTSHAPNSWQAARLVWDGSPIHGGRALKDFL